MYNSDTNNYNQYGDQHPPQDRKGLAIASMILGILSLVFMCAPGLNILLSTLAIIFGGVSLKSSGRGMAIAGLVTGLVALAIILLFFLLFAAEITSSPFYEFESNNYY
ncbi:MAG TPA: DUF4190 domain-containing protein [Bacillota bacterium]|nr:DUF4190 domain-containing protein [Bacillota bacterium]